MNNLLLVALKFFGGLNAKDWGTIMILAPFLLGAGVLMVMAAIVEPGAVIGIACMILWFGVAIYLLHKDDDGSGNGFYI